jgi:nitrile hydratase
MNGAHDCGGMMGFGAVVLEENEPVFHAPWEARMFALMCADGARPLHHVELLRALVERS